ncbi:hypothetical protein B0J11DRAFT_586588 [Dendryphion nanum]|uniref:Uncharacterized protein n=1 Tax=Dendryphion nanum TaxID=256645 RepID=A0A9P9CYN9_9PLEO|nr:hypothetical protein B0J11DRAFT_586588 [Dendryphion nanum]
MPICQYAMFKELSSNSGEREVMTTELAGFDKSIDYACTEETTDTMFETASSSCFYNESDAAFTLYGSCRIHGLVVLSGASGTRAVPFFISVSMPDAVSHINITQ